MGWFIYLEMVERSKIDTKIPERFADQGEMATRALESFYQKSKNIYLLQSGIATRDFEPNIEFDNNILKTVRLLLIMDIFSMVFSSLNNIMIDLLMYFKKITKAREN